MKSAAPQLATLSGLHRWAGERAPAGSQIPSGTMPAARVPPTLGWHRHPDPKCKLGGKLTSCGTEERIPKEKRDLGAAETPGEAGEGSPGCCQQARRQGRRERHRDTEAAKEDGSKAEPKQTEVRRSRRPPWGLGAGGEASKALEIQAAEPVAPTQAPTSFRLKTQQQRGCPVLLGDSGRHRSAVPRPETLAANSDQTVALTE